MLAKNLEPFVIERDRTSASPGLRRRQQKAILRPAAKAAEGDTEACG